MGVYFFSSQTTLKLQAPIPLAHADATTTSSRTPIPELRVDVMENEALGLWEKIARFFRITWRMFDLAITFSPFIMSTPLVWLLSGVSPCVNKWWWKGVVWAIRRSGPAAIKFAQWAASRPDIFPENLITHFSALHGHTFWRPFEETEQTLTEELGAGWREKLVVDSKPRGSGCIATVYQGTLSTSDGDKHVAVKVVHKHVKEDIVRDVEVMRYVAHTLDAIPYLHWLAFPDCVAQFADVICAQTDMRAEAANIERFSKNFEQEPLVKFPDVYWSHVTSRVLVESFMPGVPANDFAITDTMPRKTKKKLAKIGMNAALKMIFTDSFVHADMHPGNIFLNIDGNSLTFLDCGMVAELTGENRQNLVDLFSAVIDNRGYDVGKMMVERAREHNCDDIDGFCKETERIVAEVMGSGLRLEKVRVGKVLQDLMNATCGYQVRMESNYATLMVSVMVLEGLGRMLDPKIDILSAAAPYVMKAATREAFTRWKWDSEGRWQAKYLSWCQECAELVEWVESKIENLPDWD